MAEVATSMYQSVKQFESHKAVQVVTSASGGCIRQRENLEHPV